MTFRKLLNVKDIKCRGCDFSRYTLSKIDINHLCTMTCQFFRGLESKNFVYCWVYIPALGVNE
jgi:hypothetical protein